MEISKLDRVERFVTLDGSTIRELAGPSWTAARNQSLAQATVPAGRATVEHFHGVSEEIYYFAAGRGRMRLGGEERDVVAGDCVVIPPGTRHKLWAGVGGDLVLLCACAPAYLDADTQLTEPVPEVGAVDWGLGNYARIAVELLPAAASMIEAGDPRPGERVVDVGCGTGNAALLAAERGAQVVGVDPSGGLLGLAVAAAGDRGLEATFVVGDAAGLPVGDGSADRRPRGCSAGTASRSMSRSGSCRSRERRRASSRRLSSPTTRCGWRPATCSSRTAHGRMSASGGSSCSRRPTRIQRASG